MTRNLFSRLKHSATNIVRCNKSRTLVVLAVLVCGSIAFIARAYNGAKSDTREPPREIVSRPTPPSPAVQGEPREPTRLVRFNLYDVGIYPREVHVNKGLIAITIEDYSGGSAGLIVDRETGGAPERAGQVARRGPHWRGRDEMRLGPGRYIVYMADLPANRALLVVEP